jgi:peptide deformylase
VKIKALDRDGKPYELIAEGLLAVCIQHECDHSTTSCSSITCPRSNATGSRKSWKSSTASKLDALLQRLAAASLFLL